MVTMLLFIVWSATIINYLSNMYRTGIMIEKVLIMKTILLYIFFSSKPRKTSMLTTPKMRNRNM